MRTFIIIVISSIFLSCHYQQEDPPLPASKANKYSEAEARTFFKDSIAGSDFKEFTSDKFIQFLKRFYPDLKTITQSALLYAMEEPLVDTSNIDDSDEWFRVTVDPCFRNPYSIIVKKEASKCLITLKITNGFGCQYTGMLTSLTNFVYSKESFDTITRNLSNLHFWSLKKDTTCHGGLDGEEWLLEAVSNGNYNAIYRWAPQSCGDSTTRKLAEIVKHLAARSRLDEILSVLGAPKSGL